ncbi:MAG: rolling circle replication-associated protein [Cetobacterium sp.]
MKHVDESAIADDDANEQLEQTTSLSEASPLDISGELETTGSEKPPKPGFGGIPRRTNFGTYARRQLLRCGGVFDKIDTNPGHSIFLTGTLPGSTDEAKQAIANYSSYIIHGLKAWVNKYVPGKLDFYVWELQKRGALHLHYAVYVPNEVARNYLLSEFRNEWERILCSVCVMSGVDVWRRDSTYTHADDKSVLQAYAQTVDKSVAAYLSKYCSKESSKYCSNHSLKYFPVRWWGCSRPLLAKLREMSETHDIPISSVAQARRTYDLLTDDCERHSIFSYAYKDKVGTGVNFVSYYKSDDLELVMNEIRGSYVPLTQDRLLSASAHVSELARIVLAIDRAPGVKRVISANLSPKSSQVAIALVSNQPINSFDAFALSSELYAISRQYAATRAHIPVIMQRIPLRCSAISSYFQNDVLIEGLIPFSQVKSAK